VFAAIRIRSSIGLRRDTEDTLKMLRLDAVNNCVLVPATAAYMGMLEKCKDACTWGEINKETLAAMLEKRLRLQGNGRVDEKVLKEAAGFDSFEKFADALMEGKIKLKDFEKIKPVFRLTPPSKGFKSVKEHYPAGDLGYRGKEINELIERMI
jgi:large subunit ribosomal protein L30